MSKNFMESEEVVLQRIELLKLFTEPKFLKPRQVAELILSWVGVPEGEFAKDGVCNNFEWFVFDLSHRMQKGYQLVARPQSVGEPWGVSVDSGSILSQVLQEFNKAVRLYAAKNEVNEVCPIEGDLTKYLCNDHKWEGKWLIKRQRFVAQLQKYFETGEESWLDDTNWAPLPLDFDSPAELLISVLKAMLTKEYRPHDPRMGVCSNFDALIDQAVWVGQHNLVISRARDLLGQQSEDYAHLHDRERFYPIEGTKEAYRSNPDKWEGEWLEKRRKFMRYVILKIRGPL